VQSVTVLNAGTVLVTGAATASPKQARHKAWMACCRRMALSEQSRAEEGFHAVWVNCLGTVCKRGSLISR